MTAVLEVKSLSKTYGEGPNAVRAIDELSFSVERRRVRLHRRAFRLREDDSAEVPLRPPSSHERRGLPRRRPDRRACRATRACVPGVQPVAPAVDDGKEERHAPPPRATTPAKRERERLAAEALEAVGLFRLLRSTSVAALGRHAAAGGDRPRARVRASPAPDGRAVCLGRCPDARRSRGSRPQCPRGERGSRSSS